MEAVLSTAEPFETHFGPIWFFWGDAREELKGQAFIKLSQVAIAKKVERELITIECDEFRLAEMSKWWERATEEARKDFLAWFLSQIKKQFEAYGDPLQCEEVDESNV